MIVLQYAIITNLQIANLAPFYCYLQIQLFISEWKTTNNLVSPKALEIKVQLNKNETDPCILQIFQSNTLVCLIISVFCKSCEPMLCEPEIVQKICS